MRFVQTKEIEIEPLPIDARKVLEGTRKTFNHVLHFIKNSVDKELAKRNIKKIPDEKLKILAARASSHNPNFVANSALDHYLYIREKFKDDPYHAVEHRDDGFSLVEGFRYDEKRNSLYIDDITPLNLPIYFIYPTNGEVKRIRFLNKDGRWFIVIEINEYEIMDSIALSESLDEWSKLSLELNGEKTTRRCYRPENSAMTTELVLLDTSNEEEEFLEKARKVHQTNFNIITDFVNRNFDLKKLYFFRENTTLKLFTKLKELGCVKEFEIPDGIARSVCRDVSSYLNYFFKNRKEGLKLRDVDKTNFFFVTSSRVFIDAIFNRILLPGRITLRFKSSQHLISGGGVIIFIKDSEGWKAQISQPNEASLKMDKKNKEYFRKIYRNNL